MQPCLDGEIGRRTRLKILCPVRGVRVQAPLQALTLHHYRMNPMRPQLPAVLAVLFFLLNGTLAAQEQPLFTRMRPEETGISWRQELSRVKIPTDSLMRINSMVPGCGVGIADFTGDGRPDLVFTNFTGVAFYRNDGDLKFTDISSQIGYPNDSLFFSTGVNIIDIDADGDNDIFLTRWQNTCRLLINDGSGKFTEQAAEFGLNYKNESVHSVFFDYDKDGLLDCYIVVYSNYHQFLRRDRVRDSIELAQSLEKQQMGNVTQKFEAIEDSSLEQRERTFRMLSAMENRHSGNTDKLYRNLGNGKFEDASMQSWIRDKGMGLSATVADINLDGWPDIYVANDFNSTDLIYLNNGDGTFAESMMRMTRRASVFSMGSDVADLNRDGLPDIVTTDMLPESHVRRIINTNATGDMSIYNPTYDSNQVSRNMVQLNRGYNQFSEIGYMTGMAATDWSWACLIQDFDLDGRSDVFIGNGYVSDLSDQDYVYNLNSRSAHANNLQALREPNFLFRQTGDLTFKNVAKEWGVNDTSATFGAAWGDLDGDGDYELVVPNYDTLMFVYKNNAVEQRRGNYIALNLVGSGANKPGLGAKVRVVAGGIAYYRENYVVRGFQSQVDGRMIIGLGNAAFVDSVIVEWPDGRSQVLASVEPNTSITLQQSDAAATGRSWFAMPMPDTSTFVDATSTLGILYHHKENYFDDFKRFRLMPVRASWGGPSVAVADVNGDGLDDVVFGSSRGFQSKSFLQTKGGTFVAGDLGLDRADSTHEIQAMLLIDIDNDGDRDLVLACGGVEFNDLDRERGMLVYTNDGKGRYSKRTVGVPAVQTNATTLNAADFDNDGDIDLFVGGGVRTNQYPLCENSFLLVNDGKGNFTDVTDSLAPGLRNVGLVRSALWTDIDNDDRHDLVVVGEWMPITIFGNTGAGFVNKTSTFGLDSTVSWWYSVTGADLDNDGDVDYILGNQGLNHRYKASPEKPIIMYAGDFDDNGSIDPLITYITDTGKRQLMRDRHRVFSQMPTMNRKFNDFRDFAFATIDDILEPEMKDTCYKRTAVMMESVVLMNNGGSFTIKPLPQIAQIAPIMGIEAIDLNEDDYLDIVISGNMYGAEDDVVRYDAGKGLVLHGNGAGDFTPLLLPESGFVTQYDARGLATVKNPGSKEQPYALVAPINQSNAMTYIPSARSARLVKVLPVDPSKTRYSLVKMGNSTRKVEVYCGSAYRSQSSCNIIVPATAVVVSMPVKGQSGPARRSFRKSR